MQDHGKADRGPDQAADHGGGLDAAVARWGGSRADWIDLSTGINPAPYPLPALPADCWTALPDAAALQALCHAARRFWQVPDAAEIVPTAGASAIIARMPALAPFAAAIPGPTYNEHARAYRHAGLPVTDHGPAPVTIVVHPNNPDGRLWPHTTAGSQLTVIDESFCDVIPQASQIARTAQYGVLVLKSFGKFWGLAGLRLGFAIATRATLTGPQGHLADLLGPWCVSGPAIATGTAALTDPGWADATRQRLTQDAARLDGLMTQAGAVVAGGTPLFRLYDVGDAARWQDHLAQARIWTRLFPYSSRWLRLGLPPATGWPRLAAALEALT